MINRIGLNALGFVFLVLLQVLVLNNIHYFHVATPFLYIYFILKLPLNMTQSRILLLSFLLGLTIDIFSNTPGMHASIATLLGFMRNSIIRICVNKEIDSEVAVPSLSYFGIGSFMRYASIAVLLHHIALFTLESLSFFSIYYLTLRIVTSAFFTILLISIVELIYDGIAKSGR